MSKHTPGSWTVDRVEMPSGPLWTIHSETPSGLLADVWVEANARLIAASPDLLSALKECLAFVKSDYEGSGGRDLSGGVIGRALAAIAKAEGGSNE